MNLYPESKTCHLQALIAKTTGYKLNENNILLGNGSNEILEFIVRATLNTKSEVIIPKHSFLVYEIISLYNYSTSPNPIGCFISE